MLWRLSYLRGTRPSGVTFAADDLCEAMEFSDLWCVLARVRDVTLTALGQSHFTKGGKRRAQESV